VFRPRRAITISGSYPLAAVAGVLALALGVPGMAKPAGHPAHPAGAASHPGSVWATTVTGRKVLVPKNPKFIPTPVHPEKLTHPGADSMGAVTAAHAPRPRLQAKPDILVEQLPGIDISSYQGNINWNAVAPHVDWVYAKATEGTYYENPYFYNQYEGPYDHGVIRGAYHFGVPDNSSGQSQARYFIAHGGGWSSDGLTLPGALDIEYNPYGSECYGLDHSQMVSWIWDFVQEYASKEHAYPTIYTTTDWWSTCTGNSSRFSNLDPLWIANYSASYGGPLPRGWGFYTFWQYSDAGSLPGDQDVFNGDHNRLRVLAKNG
jgi:GH25 family lysozyme M1 (1,4-beta-N-acetylmuramidase)